MAVGFFTHGIEFSLPHPPIPQRTILLICSVIKRAWQILSEDPPDNFDLQSADEDTITQILVQIIENYLRKNGEIAGFDTARFGRVSRDSKVPNFDNKHPDKMPDIFFDLKRDKYAILSDQDGLFVECKPIDRKHRISSCYCKKGLERFIIGDYAWAMQDALMVGYVKGQNSFTNLASVLDHAKTGSALKTTNHGRVNKGAIYRSTHKREFTWTEGRGDACHISVSHLWLSL